MIPAPPSPPPAERRRLGRFTKVFLVVVLLLGAARIALPYAVQAYVNHTLDALPDYDGRIGDVDIALIRGAYTIQDVSISKVSGEERTPFFQAEEVDLSILWEALLRGELVSEVDLYQPQLNFVSDQEGTGLEQSGEDQPWIETVKDLSPIRIDRLTVHDGEVTFTVPLAETPVQVALTDVQGAVLDLSNRPQDTREHPSHASFEALALGQAPLRLDLELDPFAARPDFALELELEALEVPRLNDLLAVYAPLDAEAGRFSLAVELDVEEGQVRGSAKPAFDGLRLISLSDLTGDDENPLGAALDAAGEALTEVFEAEEGELERFATEVPLAGELDDVDAGWLPALFGVVRNAFVETVRPVIDGGSLRKAFPRAVERALEEAEERAEALGGNAG